MISLIGSLSDSFSESRSSVSSFFFREPDLGLEGAVLVGGRGGEGLVGGYLS